MSSPKESAAKTDAPATKASYRMPRPPQGIVLWRPTPDTDPVPALVTSDGASAIAVMIFPPSSRTGIVKDSVLHISDPRVQAGTNNPSFGCWDFTREHKLLMRIAAAVADLSETDIPGVSDAALAFMRETAK